MKRIVYSTVTKVIASILFVASVVYSVLVFTNCFIEYYSWSDEAVYRFERSFDDTELFEPILYAPLRILFNTCVNAYSTAQASDTESIADAIEENLKSAAYYDDKIDYFIKYADRVFTNCGAKNAIELTEARFYALVECDEDGKSAYDVTSWGEGVPWLLEELYRVHGETVPITVSARLKETYVFEVENDWRYQKTVVREAAIDMLVALAAAMLAFVYLLCVCGNGKDGEQKRIWVDNIWTEVHLAVIAGCGIGAAALWIFLIEEYIYSAFALEYFNVIIGTSAALASAVILTSILSVVRNIKCRNFLASTLIFQIVKLIFKILTVVLKWLGKALKWLGRRLASCVRTLALALSKWTGVVIIGALIVYTVLVCLVGIFAVGWDAPILLIFAALVLMFAAITVAYRSHDVEEIKKGVAEIRGGNVSYKIPEPRSFDLKALASNVNDIAKGLDESVAAKVKAERLKTELITNVSHDLKTPITSIISYAQLLSESEGLSEEAMDYVQVISRKGERLKNLTQDLFDISKAQSGNEDVVLEKLDASLLINQSLAEHESDIDKSGLSFVVDAPKELYFMADGRKMSRVLDNLISNALKYSLKSTRVFISAREKDGEIIMELKNIACYPMEFSAHEIVGRFVRGDEARTAEGNGLGLAIVKSYTELCGGVFEVVTDGDMFKAILKFKEYR